MKSLITFFFFRTCMLASFAFPLIVQGQEPEWWALVQGTYTESCNGMCKDDAGNIYVTGQISEGTIAGTPVSVSGAYDSYLAKFNAAGGLEWVSTAGGAVTWEPGDRDSGSRVIFDSVGNALYLCGSYSGPAVFGPGIQLLGEGSFIAKYDMNGACQWVRSSSGGYGKTMGTDGAGNVYWYSISLSPSFNMTYHGTPNITVALGPSMAKYSSEGQLLWAKSLGHNIDGQIAVHGGRIYFGGGTYGTSATLFDVDIPHNGADVALIAALDTSSNTNVLWHRVYGSSVLANIIDMAFVNDSILLLTGAFKDSVFLPEDTLTGLIGEYHPYYLRVDSAGSIQFAKAISVNSSLGLITSASDGEFYLGIRFNGTLDLPTASLTSNGPWDFAIIRCDPQGEPIVAMQIGPVPLGWMNLMAADDGGIVACGKFVDSINLGGGQVLTGNNDAFVAKYSMITSVSTLKSLAGGELLIYANPNKGTCSIELPEALLHEQGLVLRIMDAQGRVVQESPLNICEGTVHLDIRSQATGTYVAEVGNASKRYTGRIVFE